MAKLPDNCPSIPWSALPLKVGRSSEADLRLTDPTVSRLHAEFELRDGRPWVRDLGSRFGTFVNGVQIRQRLLQLGDRVRLGQRIIYACETAGLCREDAPSLALRVDKVAVAAGERTLVSFGTLVWDVFPGTLVGILGPSGVGKSMLLRTLAGIRPPATGVISCGPLVDVWQEIELYRHQLAYIPQDDVVVPLLSVRENLLVAAQMRLGDRLDPEEINTRIEQALELFGLAEHAHKLVRILSGGQRKRVSVAMEWLRQPKIFFLDEPTAGLDPANEARLMEELVKMTRTGATAICTTHLMNSIHLVDEILVLGLKNGRGEVAYLGPPQGLLPTLGCRHFADVYEKLERGQFDGLGGEKSAGSELPDQPRPETPVRSSSGGSDRIYVPPPPVYKLAIPPARLFDLRAIAVILQRSATELWRDRGRWWLTIGQPIILALVVAITQFNPGRLAGLFFFTTVVACWLGMNNSIRDLVRDRRVYIRDRLGGLAPLSYLTAKLVFFTAVGAIQLVLFLPLLRIAAGFILPEGLRDDLADKSYLWWWLWLLLTYLGGLLTALAVSAWVKSEEAAQAWLPILILPQILLSATATGVAPLKYTDARPFRPLAVTLRYPFTEAASDRAPEERAKLGFVAFTVDMLSLALVCRPAALLVERPSVKGFPTTIWLADCCHLLCLLLIEALVLWVVFESQERYWPALVGY